MKKGKITITVTIGLMVLILTTVIFIQFKTINQTDITSLENMREDELRTEISNFKQKAEEINKKIEETDSKIAEYDEAIATDKEASEILANELEQQNNLLGKNDVKGNGVVITLTDTRAQKITAEDLRQLVNQLKEAGAEAISINDQRIILTTSVECDGNVIKVNGVKIGAPFEIKAIGFPEYLSGAMNRQGGYLMNLKEYWGIETSVTKSSDITIPKYTGVIKYNYIESR